MKKIFLVVTLLTLTKTVAFSENLSPEIVITPNKLKTPINATGSSITVITEEEIKNKNTNSIIEVLKSVPGLDIVQSGGAGGISSVFLRGANAEHTLVLIDGIEMNSPISPTRAFDFADITLDNVERIEILKGPQSTLYGSDALGGVINIFTKSGQKGQKTNVSFELGSRDTYREAISTGNTIDDFAYSLAVSRQDTNGISAVKNLNTMPSENDGTANSAGSAKIDYKFSDMISTNFTGRINSSNSDIDNGPGFGGDDINRFFSNKQNYLRAQINTNFLDGKLTQAYGISHSSLDYKDNNDPDSEHLNDSLRSDYKGRQTKFDFQNNYLINDYITLVAGLETEKEHGSSDLSLVSDFGPFDSDFLGKSARTNAYYFQANIIKFENFSSSMGIRLDDHENFGNKSTWRFAPVYEISSSGTLIKSSIGTGFKSPSLYQLYSEYGRTDLDAEETLGYDFGIEQEIIEKKLNASITYFHIDFDHLISFDPQTFLFENIADAKTSGIETSLTATPSEELTLKANYTFTDPRDNSTNQQLLRRAKNKANFNINYRLLQNTNINFDYSFVGKRVDNDFNTFPATRVNLSSYSLLNLSLSHQIDSACELTLKLHNLLDKDYEDILGYNTEGFSILGGFRLSF